MYTSSTKRILRAVDELYDTIVDENLLVRRLNITACRVADEAHAPVSELTEQLDLFSNYADQERQFAQEEQDADREKRRQHALLEIRRRFGKNAILKGMNLEEGATARDRNAQIGGHKA